MEAFEKLILIRFFITDYFHVLDLNIDEFSAFTVSSIKQNLIDKYYDPYGDNRSIESVLLEFSKTNNDGSFHSFSGTKSFLAPEVASKLPHDPFLADVWSLGITFYFFITGRLPWTSSNDDNLRLQILYGSIPFQGIKNTHIVRFIRSMLERDVKLRPTVNKLLLDPLFDSMKSVKKPLLQSTKSVEIMPSLKNVRSLTSLKLQSLVRSRAAHHKINKVTRSSSSIVLETHVDE